MTVLGTYTPVRETGNGSKVDFDFSFKVLQASDLDVGKVLNSTEVKTDMVLGVDYTVALNTVTDGGTVTYTVAPTALQDSWIGRAVPATQAQDIPTNGVFREVQVENALDKATMVLQQHEEILSRCVKTDEVSSTTPDQLVAAIAAAAVSTAADASTCTTKAGEASASAAAAAASAATLTFASQAEAEAGLIETKGMNPLRTAQAIAALAPTPTIASQAEAEAGTDNTKMMTSLRVKEGVAVHKALGAWASKTPGTIYQAATDGFVVCRSYSAAGATVSLVATDGSTPPTTYIAYQDVPAGASGSVCSPIRKGDYYIGQATGTTATVYFIALGT